LRVTAGLAVTGLVAAGGVALVTAAKAKGAAPIISFGGQAGTELATGCTTTTKLVAAYTSVIHTFTVTKIDFDIEGAARINDTATNARR
jgi:hypothetical protein